MRKKKLLSIQNEAKAVQTWDSCVYTAEIDFLVNHLKPTLRKRNHEEILVFIWDHNKERVFDRANAQRMKLQNASYQSKALRHL